jgi:hypothetical protein
VFSYKVLQVRPQELRHIWTLRRLDFVVVAWTLSFPWWSTNMWQINRLPPHLVNQTVGYSLSFLNSTVSTC